MAAVLADASYYMGGFSPCQYVSARRVMVPGGGTFHLEPGTISHKYSVQIPSTVQEAYMFDKANGHTFCCDALNKDMENLKLAFDIFPGGKSPPVHYFKESGYFIFDVSMNFE